MHTQQPKGKNRVCWRRPSRVAARHQIKEENLNESRRCCCVVCVLLRVGGTTLSLLRWKNLSSTILIGSLSLFYNIFTCDWAAGREFHANEKRKNADGQQLGTWFWYPPYRSKSNWNFIFLFFQLGCWTRRQRIERLETIAGHSHNWTGM